MASAGSAYPGRKSLRGNPDADLPPISTVICSGTPDAAEPASDTGASTPPYVQSGSPSRVGVDGPLRSFSADAPLAADTLREGGLVPERSGRGDGFSSHSTGTFHSNESSCIDQAAASAVVRWYKYNVFGDSARQPGEAGESDFKLSDGAPEGSVPGKGERPQGRGLIQLSIGVCAMKVKTHSKPMREILSRLARWNEFHIVVFDEQMILEDDIAVWPRVDCLICFFSTGFPLEKAIDYVKRFRPILLNDLEQQKIIRDRVLVYEQLKRHGIPHPSYVVVDYERVSRGADHFEEGYDYIVINDKRLNKPFIEKPREADNHDNWIYYPKNTGGGCKKLYRKQQNSSSSYCPDVHTVRKDGTYIYEEFLSTFGTDVKVYTVGPLFAHAEARKSPSVDGVVCRSPDGKEVRYPVILTEQEKWIAYRLVRAFQQIICGFDILRTSSGPFVCDVNGFSFVKGNIKYYEDCANILRLFFIKKSIERWSAFGIPTHVHTALSPTGPCPSTCEGTRTGDSNVCGSSMPGRDPKPGGGAAAFVASPQVILQQLLHARNEYRTQQQYSQRRDCEADHGDLERPGGCRATSVSSVVDSAPEGRAAPSETGAEQHSPEKRSEPVLANSVPLKTAEAPQSTEDSACIQGRQGDESFHDDHSPMPGGIAPSKEADWNSPSSHEVAKDESSFAPVVYSLASSSGAEPHSESGLLKIRSDRSGFGERVSGQQAVSQGGSFSPYTTAGEGSGDEDEELRTVVVVMRHGDRKPKQKLKFQTEQDLILELFEGRSPRKEVKLKSPEELKDLLERNTEIITSMGREMASLVAGIKTLSEHKAAAEAAAKASTSSDPKPTSESPGSGTASPCDHVPELGPGTPEGGPPRVVFSQPFGLMKDEASCMATPSPPDSTSNPDGSGHIVADVTAALERQEGLVAKLQKELAQHKQLQKVLLQGDGFAGINRKIQLKPTEWDDAGFSSDSSATTKCEVPCPRDGLSEGQTVSSRSSEKKSGTAESLPGYDLSGASPPGATSNPSLVSVGGGSEGNGGGGGVSQQGASLPGGPAGRVTRCVVVAKWGGELTGIGRKQAEDLGKKFRYELYPGDSAGLLRLHSTFRHDFKIYTSDEGRCQVTSAAFTKGFLDLEGELTPILVALVIRNNKAHALLDDTVPVSERKECKKVLDELLNLNISFRDASEEQLNLVDALFRYTLQPVQLACLKEIDNPWAAMHQVYCSIRKFLDALELPAPLLERKAGAIVSCANCNGGTPGRAPSKRDYESAALPASLGDSSLDVPSVFMPPTVCPSFSTTPSAFPLPTSSCHCHSSSSDSSVTVAGSPPFTRSMACCSSSPAAAHAGRDKVAGNFFTQKVANVKQRWNTLLKEWFDAKTNVFDTSKIADVMDMLRYELIHHQYLMSLEAFSLASHAHKILLPVHAFACPSESGITATQKLRIAAQVVGRLVRKIVRDVTFFRSEDHGRPLNESQRTSAFTDWGKSMTAAAAAARLSPPPAASSPPVTLPFSQTGSLVPVEPSASVEFFSSSRPPTGACLPLDVSRYSSSSLSAAAVSHVRRQFSEPVVRIVRPAVQSSECTFPVTLTAPPSPASGGAPETAGAQAERFLPVNGHTSLGTDGPPISQRPGGPDESELVGNGAAFSESSLQDGLDVGKQEHPSGGSGLESRVSESSETAVLADAGTAALSVGLDRHLSIEGQENRRCADDETRTAAALATAAAAAVTAVARAAKAAADAATAAAAEAAADAAPTAAAPLGELVKAMCGVHGTGVSASSIYRPDPAWKGSRDLDRSPPVSELTASTARACLRASLTAPPSASPFPERAMDTLPCTTVDSRVGSPSSEVPSTGPTAGLASSSVPAAAVLGGRMIRSSSSASCCSSGRSAARGISSARGRSTGSNASSSAAKGRAAFGYCGSSSRASSSRISSKSAVAGGGSVCSIAAVSGSTGGSQLEKGGGNLMGSAGSGTVGSSGPVAQSPTAAGLCGVLGSVERIGATGSLGRTPPGDSATAVLKGSKADPAEKVVINSHELWAHQWKGKKREKREEKATSHPQAQQCRAPESTEQCSPTDGMTIAEISPRLLGLRDRNAESCSTPERQSDQDGRQGTSEEVEIKALHEKRRETTGVDGGSKTDLQPGNAGERLEDKGGETKGNEQQGRHAADENERDDEEDHEEHEDDDPHEHEMTAQIRLKEEEARMFGIRSPWRIVRSRYYVTSASHVQALLNILLFSYEVVCGPDQNQSREGSAANRDRTVQKTDSEGSERGGTIGSACSEPLLDSDVDEEALGTCDLHYLSHIVFRVWERKRDRGQPEKSGTADSRYSSPAKHEKTAVGRQPTVAASPPAQQSSRNSDVSSSPYRLEISFSTGAKDGFGRDFFLIERDAQQHQVLSRGAAGPGMAGESGIKTDPRAAGNCRGYEGGSLPGMSQPRAVLGPPRFTPSFLKRGLHDEEDDDFVGLHHEQACRSCACPPATRLSADGVGGDAQRSCRTTKALESETVRPVQTGCRPASSCGWYCPSQASSGAPNSDSDSDVAGARMDGREQRRPAERPGTSPPASCAFGLFSRPTWPAQGSGHSISSSVAPPECVSTSGRTGGGPGSDGVQGDSGYDSKPGHLCWGREEASQLLRGRRGPGATGVAAEDSRGGSYKGAGVLMAPYCELAPLVSLAHSSDLERFEVLMSKVLSLYGSQKCPKTNKDRAP